MANLNSKIENLKLKSRFTIGPWIQNSSNTTLSELWYKDDINFFGHVIYIRPIRYQIYIYIWGINKPWTYHSRPAVLGWLRSFLRVMIQKQMSTPTKYFNLAITRKKCVFIIKKYMDFYYFISLWILGLSYYWTFMILLIYYDFIKLIRQFIHPGLEEVN